MDGGCPFIKHLQDNLPPLSFSFIKNVPCVKKSLACLSASFALSLNLCFLVLRPCGKLALVMSRDPVLSATIKKAPWVLGRLCDKTIGVLKQ